MGGEVVQKSRHPDGRPHVALDFQGTDPSQRRPPLPGAARGWPHPVDVCEVQGTKNVGNEG